MSLVVPRLAAPTSHRFKAWMIAVCLSSAAVLGTRDTASEEAHQASEPQAFFAAEIEPILRKRCYGCHSHEAGTMEGGLTLDWHAGWATGGSRGPAIVPGDPEASLLVRAIRHDDPDLAMPEERLPDGEIAALVEWIRRGAADPRTTQPDVAAGDPTDWWSLAPLERPVVPTVPDATGNQATAPNPVDAFVLARLAAEGLAPAAEADRRTLVRRVFFDLHGLPPSPEEVAAFLADTEPDAYERLVERLLASPRYGERWARHWLDTIHFADSHGFEHDVFRPNAWRYRDYVIASLNADLPWDRFVKEQLAADVFFPEATDRHVALGYLGAGPYDHSAASTAPRAFEHLDRDDLVTQTLGAFASTTASCARCHAHKFDPIAQEDYYALQAVFAGVGKGEILYESSPQVARERKRWQSLAEAAAAGDPALLAAEESREIVAAWEVARGTAATWQPLDLLAVSSGHGATLSLQPDGSVLSGGTRPDIEATTVVATTPLPRITAIRLDVLTDTSLPMQGPGRMDNGNLHLSEFSLRVIRPGSPEGTPVAIRQATADFNQDGWTISHAIDGIRTTAWGIHPAVGMPHQAIFELAQPLELSAETRLALVLEQAHGGGHVIGRFRLAATDGDPLSAIALAPDALAALAKPAADRSAAEAVALASAIVAQRAARELAALPPPEKVYAAGAVAENERGVIRYDEPREIRLLKRGNIDAPGEVIGPGALAAVTALKARFDLPEGHHESERRAALAKWLTDPANPLTWRSIANRVWHFHVGRGLCDTPGDFGRMGSLPSHPELLDYLACELRDTGSLKSLHRLICTSDTYRRSGSDPAADPEAVRRDPDNRLLARGSRRRLDADSLRDAILQVSGQLNLTMGGPGDQHFSQKPGPQLTPVLNYDDVDWAAADMARRSIYRVVWRGIADPFFEAFDFPDLGLLVPERGFSVSPLQSLVLLNHPFVLHQAAAMARSIEAEVAARPAASEGSRAAEVRAAVRRAWLREPTDDEAATLGQLASDHGLEAVCRLLFSSNEFLFVE